MGAMHPRTLNPAIFSREFHKVAGFADKLLFLFIMLIDPAAFAQVFRSEIVVDLRIPSLTSYVDHPLWLLYV
jgi:hypothetical protein